MKTLETISQEEIYLISDTLILTLQDIGIEEVEMDKRVGAISSIMNYLKENKVGKITFCSEARENSIIITLVLGNGVYMSSIEREIRGFYRRIVKFGWCKSGSSFVSSTRVNRLGLVSVSITISRLKSK